MKRLLIAVLALAIVASGQKREVTVAAAANLNEVFQVIGPQFEAATGIHPVFSFASTAQLAQQIANGAPYDVFAAADVGHVPEPRTIYATGILALWIPNGAAITPADLVRPEIKVIAMAKPELAPYGLAAKQTLEKLGIWSKVESKIVYADNINMAKQYGTSGNADAVFTAYSLVMKERGKVTKVEESLHAPIDQALGIVAASKNQPAARAFADFLLIGKGKKILSQSGYRVH